MPQGRTAIFISYLTHPMKEQNQNDRGFASMNDEANRLNNTGSTSQGQDTGSDSRNFNDRGRTAGSGADKGR